MIAAAEPVQRPPDAKLLVVSRGGSVRHWPRTDFARLLRPGDLIVANDAATLPASLSGIHLPSRRPVEVRLAARDSLDEIRRFHAVIFGGGDFHVRTEDRIPPPRLAARDGLQLGPLQAVIEQVLDHERLAVIRFPGSPRDIWEGLALHGRPIQYSHVQKPLALWDSWTSIASVPAAFEPPSAGFLLDWNLLDGLAAGRIRFCTITHSAGISSTGDAELDARLPFDEPYRISAASALAIGQTRAGGGRIIAIGTTVVRALEHAAAIGNGVVAAGDGLATNRIQAASRVQVVDALVSGTHEPQTSHYELLRAFVEDETLRRMDQELNTHNYRAHEFGDSVFVEGQRTAAA